MLKSAADEYEKARPYEKTIRQFGEILKNDNELYQKLEETPDKESFIEMYLNMAAEQGFNFSRDELMVAVHEQKHGQDWVIPSKVQRLIRDRF